MNRRDFLATVTTTAAAVACEALPEDNSCDIVVTGRERVECPRPATLKYAPGASHPMRFCTEHAAVHATMPLVPV
jgi:hypothetical protein